MATSGSGTSNADGQGMIKVHLNWWQLSQDIGANKTRIRLELQVEVRPGASLYGSANLGWNINCNGSNGGSWQIGSMGGNTRTIGTRDVDIYHNGDGTKSFGANASVTFNATFNGRWIGTVNVSTGGTLNTIPRASKASVTGNISTNQTITIHTNRHSGSFTHRIRVNYGFKDIDVFNNVGDSVNVFLDRSKYAPQCTDRTSRGLWIYCTTYQNGRQIGSEQRTDVTLSIDGGVVPSVSSLKLSDDSGLASTWGGYVQGRSRVRAQVSSSGAYGSSITRTNITWLNVNLDSTNAQLGTTNQQGRNTVTAQVTDSRGRTAKRSASFTVLSYSQPTLAGSGVWRTPNDESSTVRVHIKGSTTNLANNGKNTASVEIAYRRKGETNWRVSNTSNRGLSWDTNYDLTGLSSDLQWEIRISARDQLGTLTQQVFTINTASPILDFRRDGHGVGIGAVANDYNAVDVGWNMNLLAGATVNSPVTGVREVGRTGANNEVRWYELVRNQNPGFDNGVSSDWARIIGAVGGYGNGSTGFIDLSVAFRARSTDDIINSITVNQSAYADTNSASLYIIMDSSGYCHIYIRACDYYSFNVLVLGQGISCPRVWTDSQPEGTVLWHTGSGSKVSDSMLRLGGNLLLPPYGGLSLDIPNVGRTSVINTYNGDHVNFNWTHNSTGLGGMVFKRIWTGNCGKGGTINTGLLGDYNLFAARVKDWNYLLFGLRCTKWDGSGWTLRLTASGDDGVKLEMCTVNLDAVGGRNAGLKMLGSSRHVISGSSGHEGLNVTELYGVL